MIFNTVAFGNVCAGWSEPLLVAHTTLSEIHATAHIKQSGLIVIYRAHACKWVSIDLNLAFKKAVVLTTLISQ